MPSCVDIILVQLGNEYDGNIVITDGDSGDVHA